MLLEHRGNCVSMDRLVMMVKDWSFSCFSKSAIFDMSNRLEKDCTNNQVEYKALYLAWKFCNLWA